MQWVKLVISVAVPLAVGFTSSLFNETGEGSWYRSIQKPSWNPPSWVFAPVWTVLYVLMGLAFYLIWRSHAAAGAKRAAIGLWTAQLLLNFFWTFIFFGQRQIGWALVEIVCLWLLILLTVFAFAKIRKTAAWLLVPYIGWVSFAALLNFAIWRLNA